MTGLNPELKNDFRLWLIRFLGLSAEATHKRCQVKINTFHNHRAQRASERTLSSVVIHVLQMENLRHGDESEREECWLALDGSIQRDGAFDLATLDSAALFATCDVWSERKGRVLKPAGVEDLVGQQGAQPVHLGPMELEFHSNEKPKIHTKATSKLAEPLGLPNTGWKSQEMRLSPKIFNQIYSLEEQPSLGYSSALCTSCGPEEQRLS
ncbi:unnamed protein product [Eretmochelys imbricata]